MLPKFLPCSDDQILYCFYSAWPKDANPPHQLARKKSLLAFIPPPILILFKIYRLCILYPSRLFFFRCPIFFEIVRIFLLQIRYRHIYVYMYMCDKLCFRFQWLDTSMRCIACFQLREELKGIVLSFEVRKTVGQDLQVTLILLWEDTFLQFTFLMFFLVSVKSISVIAELLTFLYFHHFS